MCPAVRHLWARLRPGPDWEWLWLLAHSMLGVHIGQMLWDICAKLMREAPVALSSTESFKQLIWCARAHICLPC